MLFTLFLLNVPSFNNVLVRFLIYLNDRIPKQPLIKSYHILIGIIKHGEEVFYELYHRYCREMYRHNHRSNDCVCDNVKDIIRAQNKVKDDDCSTGCNSAIEKLRNPGHEHGPRYTTIPFVLYSKGTSKPFIGSGVFKNPGHKQ